MFNILIKLLLDKCSSYDNGCGVGVFYSPIYDRETAI